jgi:two-component system phosphate regulon sensor histidine kinase PhoR
VRWNPRLFLLFFAPYLLSVTTVTLTVGLYADWALEGQHLRTLASVLLREAELAGNALPWDLGGAELERRCRELAPAPAVRLTVIHLDGTVLCDSEATPANMENHLLRPEVQQALKGGDGENVRRSATIGERLMYRAYVQRRGDEQRIVRLAVPMTTITEAQQRIRSILLLALALAAGLGLWPAVRLSQWLSRRIDAMVTFSQAVAADREPPRLAAERRDELGLLEENLSTMGRAVSERLRATREEEQKLRAVLAGMVEGVLVVTERGELVLLNERAREIFGLDPAHDYGGRPIVEICRDPELQQLIRDTVRLPTTTARLAREISIAGEASRVLAVNAAPVHGDQAPLGYVLVFHEITELKKLEAVRRDFVANVSHELRTPLTAIRGYAETLLTGALDDAQNARKFLGVIERNAERLTRLIDDLLTLSDLELGRLGLQRTAVSAKAAIEAACEVVSAKALRGGVTLRREDAADLPPIDGDGDRVEQVLVNLIDNAVKYTPSGGCVTVTARRAANGDSVPARPRPDGSEYVEVAVTDTGIGIPSQELPRLTERFYRVDKARSRELGGTGLGLAIVKHIMQVHGGWMRIESELGRGTTVRVAFPAAERTAATSL